MTTGLIQPIPTVQAAINAGILTPAERVQEIITRGQEKWNETQARAIRLPSEVGLQAIHPCPKRDRRTGPKPKRERRYINIITRKDRPDLFP